MKRALGLMLVVTSVVAIAFTAGTATAAPAKKQDTSLTGAGATFPYPLISKWIPAVGSAYGININYSPIGSGGGISAITARTVDFGASDAPLTSDQLAACKGCVVIPWALSAISIPYNLPGVKCVVRLTAGVLSGIYLGEITKWNDAKITQNNGTCDLPDLKITPVYRSDNSGSTYAFTDYLSNVSAAWKSKFGTGVNAQWPAGVGARGSSGVAGVVTKTAGALTYVDIAYSLQNKLRVGWVQNKAGKFTSPGLRGIQASASVLPKKISDFTQLKLVDPPKSAGNLAYPISTFTYVIAPTSSGKAADLRKFIYWAVTRGQTYGKPLLFQPLPSQVQAYAYREIKKIQSSTT
jgi:phosphate transport system substrate-binding protein